MCFLRTRRASSGRERLAGDTTLGMASFPGLKRRRRFRPGPGNEATLDNTCTTYAKRYLPIWMIYNHHFLEPDHT